MFDQIWEVDETKTCDLPWNWTSDTSTFLRVVYSPKINEQEHGYILSLVWKIFYVAFWLNQFSSLVGSMEFNLCNHNTTFKSFM